MGWDVDDVFSLCHHEGQFAFDDPNQLVYCAEAPIDQLLFADPHLYARYVDSLEELLVDFLTVERFGEALDRTAADLLPFFERSEICGAMVELLAANPAAIEPAEARRDIEAALAALAQTYGARRELLLERIAAYRSQVGR